MVLFFKLIQGYLQIRSVQKRKQEKPLLLIHLSEVWYDKRMLYT